MTPPASGGQRAARTDDDERHTRGPSDDAEHSDRPELVSPSPSPVTDASGRELDDWRKETLSRIRGLIEQADPDVVEEQKWRKPSNPEGVPAWSHDGMICTGEVYKDHVKVTFANGASIEDPHHLFNSSLGGRLRRAIDLHEGDELDAGAFTDLVRAAVALNEASARRR